MNLFKKRLQWLWRAWPLWVLIAVVIITSYFGNWAPPPSALRFNKIAGAIMQGLGGLLILLSIDDNLGLFRGHGMIAELREYLCSYPRVRSGVALAGSVSASASVGGCLAVGQVGPLDLDGRVAALEKLFTQLEQQMSAQKSELIDRMHEMKVEHQDALGVQAQRLTELAKKVEDTAVGGIKMQVFGIGLATIGSVLSIYS